MKKKKQLKPLEPNLGISNYDWFIPLEDILASIKFYEKQKKLLNQESKAA